MALGTFRWSTTDQLRRNHPREQFLVRRPSLAQLLTEGFEHRGRVNLVPGAHLTDLVHGKNDGTAEHVVLAEEFDLDIR